MYYEYVFRQFNESTFSYRFVVERFVELGDVRVLVAQQVSHVPILVIASEKTGPFLFHWISDFNPLYIDTSVLAILSAF
jgi:hypothetical protein